MRIEYWFFASHFLIVVFVFVSVVVVSLYCYYYCLNEASMLFNFTFSTNCTCFPARYTSVNEILCHSEFGNKDGKSVKERERERIVVCNFSNSDQRFHSLPKNCLYIYCGTWHTWCTDSITRKCCDACIYACYSRWTNSGTCAQHTYCIRSIQYTFVFRSHSYYRSTIQNKIIFMHLLCKVVHRIGIKPSKAKSSRPRASSENT